MSALDLVRIARAAGAKLIVDGSSLVLEAESPPPQQVFDMLRAHKPEILELLASRAPRCAPACRRPFPILAAWPVRSLRRRQSARATRS